MEDVSGSGTLNLQQKERYTVNFTIKHSEGKRYGAERKRVSFPVFFRDGGKIFIGIAGFLPGKRIDKKIRLEYNFSR